MSSEIVCNLVAQAENHYAQWSEKAVSAGLNTSFEDDFLAALKQVFEASEYVALNCVRHPDLLSELQESGELTKTLA